MGESFLTYVALAARLGELRGGGKTVLVGIDGAGASGKSTLARCLALANESIQLVHMDDFFRPSRSRYVGDLLLRPNGADFDRERLCEEVLAPLRAGRTAAYRRYDWNADAIVQGPIAITQSTVVIEGVYALSAPLIAFYDFTIWVECPREVRLARGLARDGEAARARWVDDWMLGEDRYMESERPKERATLVCDARRESPANGVWVVTGEGKLE